MVSGETIEKEDIERIFMGFTLEAQKQIVTHLHAPKKKVIVLAGPTCSGKSAFGIELAKAIDGEIISADSMQVYRGMDIGTAKATPEQRLEVPHHMIDIRDITDPINVVDFYYEARHTCQSVLSRDSVPIFVGGSGFYFHALLYGPPSGPPSIPELRQALEEEMETKGSEVLYERLKQLDPQYAHTITKHDKQKIIRALEIITLTGKKVSKMSWKKRKSPLNYNYRCWFLYRPKERLHERIDQRCKQMLEEGFLEEVHRLEKEGLCENSSASQAIGYRQALQYLHSKQTPDDYQEFLESFTQSTRQYVKKQFTWFRREPLFRWLDLDMHDPEVAVEMIRQDYERSL